MELNPFTVEINTLSSYFESLTGISVSSEVFTEADRSKRIESMRRQDGGYDVFSVSLWDAAAYHEQQWIEDLKPYLDDASLTDREWLGFPDDFRDKVIEMMTFPDRDGGESFVGFPNTVEVYGCVGCDIPTFLTLGIPKPTTVAELAGAARVISDSEAVD
jgi:hypothetical protein